MLIKDIMVSGNQILIFCGEGLSESSNYFYFLFLFIIVLLAAFAWRLEQVPGHQSCCFNSLFG